MEPGELLTDANSDALLQAQTGVTGGIDTTLFLGIAAVELLSLAYMIPVMLKDSKDLNNTAKGNTKVRTQVNKSTKVKSVSAVSVREKAKADAKKATAKKPAAKKATTTSKAKTAAELNKMTVAQLQAFLKKNKVAFKSSDKKADLVKKAKSVK